VVVVSELKCPPKVATPGSTRNAGTHEEPFQARDVLSKPSKESVLDAAEKVSPPIDELSIPFTCPLVAGSTLPQLNADVGVVNA
jgi:hypothetical protein